MITAKSTCHYCQETFDIVNGRPDNYCSDSCQGLDEIVHDIEGKRQIALSQIDDESEDYDVAGLSPFSFSDLAMSETN